MHCPPADRPDHEETECRTTTAHNRAHVAPPGIDSEGIRYCNTDETARQSNLGLRRRLSRGNRRKLSAMQIIPVLDIQGGIVVRAIGGRRSEYRPLVSRLTDSTEPLAVAHAMRAR